jgi:hypothetical protein
MMTSHRDLSTLQLVKNLSPDQACVQERAVASLTACAQGLVDEYRRRFGDEFNPDNGAELFSEYSSSRENRARYRLAVAAAGGWVIDEAFRQRIAMADRAPVIFSAGGTASGKSTLIVDEVKAGAVVLDSTFSNYAPSKTRLQEALESGRDVIVQYVYRDLLEAYGAVIARSKTEAVGRMVSPQTHRSTHANAAKSVARLLEDFARNRRVRFQFYESSCAGGFRRDGPVLTQRGDYTRAIIETEAAVIGCTKTEIPSLHPKLALEEFAKMSLAEQSEYLAKVAVASGNRYRGRPDLLLRESPHRDFLAAVQRHGAIPCF